MVWAPHGAPNENLASLKEAQDIASVLQKELDAEFGHWEAQPHRQFNYQIMFRLQRRFEPSWEAATALKNKLNELIKKHDIYPTLHHGPQYETTARHCLPPYKSVPIALFNQALDHVKLNMDVGTYSEMFNEKKIITKDNELIGNYDRDTESWNWNQTICDRHNFSTPVIAKRR